MSSNPRSPFALILILGMLAGAGCSPPRGEEVGFKPPSPQITPKPYLPPSPGQAGTPLLPGSVPEFPASGIAAKARPGESPFSPPFSVDGQPFREEDLNAWTPEEIKDAVFINAAGVYFYFDSADLTKDAQEVLLQKAEKIRANPGFYITIAGHADERGAEQYNLLLGERRALAAFRFLVSRGVPAARLGVVSFGKKKPAVRASGETAWSLNRRAEFFVNRLP